MQNIGRYRVLALHRSFLKKAVVGRCNSSSATIKKSKEEEESDDFMSMPWDTESSKSRVEHEEFPWETEEVEVEEKKMESVDPSKNELILAPIRKKSSIIQKLKTRTKKDSQSVKIVNETLAFKVERDYMSLMQYRQNVEPESFVNIIDELKPRDTVVTIKQLTELSQTLDKSFRVKQLRFYIGEACPDIVLKKTDNKRTLINKIISEHWKLKVTLDPTKDLVVETRIDLSKKRDFFLLLSNGGFLPQHWSLIGAELSLGKSRKELVVRGSKNIVNFVQASWNDLLNNLSSDTIDMKEIKAFYEKNNKELDLELLQQDTGVYFDKLDLTFVDEHDSVDADTYVLSSIKNSMISKAKTELLNAAEYRAGCSKIVIYELMKEGGRIVVEEGVSDESLPWFIKQNEYYRYVVAKERQSESLLSDGSMIVKLLSEEVEKLRGEIEEAKEKFEFNYVESKEGKTEMEKVEQEDIDFFKMKEARKQAVDLDQIMQKIDVARVEEELGKVETVKDDSKLMMESMISVKLGKILVKKNKEKSTHFNANVSQAIRKLGKLELMDKEAKLFGPSGGILNRFSKQAHIQLIPNGFWKNSFDKFVKYPSIDILVDLKDNRLEVNRFSSFVCEAERDVEVCIPELEYDLKFQNSKNSMFIYNKDQWLLNGRSEEEFSEDHEDMIHNKQQLNMYISQTGKKRLDIKKNEGIKGLIKQFKAKPYNFRLGTESVKYTAMRVEIVRNLELEYRKRPVSLELRDDGEHERVEVQMLHEGGNISEFVRDAVAFANDMK